MSVRVVRSLSSSGLWVTVGRVLGLAGDGVDSIIRRDKGLQDVCGDIFWELAGVGGTEIGSARAIGLYRARIGGA